MSFKNTNYNYINDIKEDIRNLSKKLDHITELFNAINLKVSSSDQWCQRLESDIKKLEKKIESLPRPHEGIGKYLVPLIKPSLLFIFGAGFVLSSVLHDFEEARSVATQAKKMTSIANE